MTDPTPRNKPPDATVYVSSSEAKILALKRALWDDGHKVHVYPDKRTDPDQNVWVLYHNAPDWKFKEIRAAITL